MEFKKNYKAAAILFSMVLASSSDANECSWQGHPPPIDTIINLLSSIVSPNSNATGFWKPIKSQGVPTGWDCDAGVDVFEYPGLNVIENNVARIGSDEQGVVVIQPLTPIVLDELEITSDSGVVIADSSILLFRGSNLDNAGKIEVGSFGLLGSPLRFSGSTSLTGGGSVKLVGGLAAIDGDGTLTNTDNKISGSGLISVQLINEDTVTAMEGMLLLTNVDQNKKDLKADDGTLRLAGETIDNTGGTIEGLTSGVVQLTDITIAGGTLSGSTADSMVTIGPTILDGAGKSGKGGGAVTIEGFFKALAPTTIVGTINNTGTLLVPGGGVLLTDHHGGGPELSGGGTVTMSGGIISNVQLQPPVPNPPPPPPRLTNVDNTIEGSGQINVLFTNQSTVTANQSASTLTINAPNADPQVENDDAVINEGTFSASDGGTLTLRGGHFNNTAGQMTATGGTLAVQDAATVTGGNIQIGAGGTLFMKNSAHISDGTVNVDATLHVDAGSNRLRGDVTLNGMSMINDGATLNIGDTIDDSGTSSYTNNGTVTIGDTGGSAGLDIAGDLTLNGSGEIHLSDFVGLANRISDAQLGPGGNAVDARLTNQDQRIHGAGLIDVQLTNRGTIEADGSTPLTVIANGMFEDTEKLINEGTLKATGGSTLILKDGKANNAGGTISAEGGSRVELSSLVIEGGNISAANGGVVDALFNVTLDGIGINLSGTYVSSGVTTLIGDITNGGDINLPTGGALQISNTGNGVNLSGGGNVNLAGGAVRFVPNEDPRGPLTNVDNTLKGFGLIEVGLTNQGTIDANHSGTLTVAAGTGTNAVNNAGTMKVSDANSRLLLRLGEFNNTGGMIMASAGTVEIRDAASVTGGDLQIDDGATLELANNVQIVDTDATFNGDVDVLSGIANILSATVNASSNITIRDGTTLIFDENGSYQSSGKIVVGESGGSAGLDIDGEVTISGGGEIELVRSFGLTNRISDAQLGPGGNAVAARLTNQDQRIFGAGLIDVELTNATVVEAANADAPLTVIANGAFEDADKLINQGTLKATGGATLKLKDGKVDNASGTISADAGSIVELSSIVVEGGTLSGDGTIDALFDVTLDGIGMTLNGTYLSSGATTLIGDITNNGDIELPTGGSLRISNSNGGVMLDGGGNVKMSGGLITAAPSENPAGTLNNADNMITGFGTVGLGMTNQGTVDADQAGTLILNAGTGVDRFINQGTLKSSSGLLQLRLGDFDNAGGMVSASGGIVEIRDAATVSGGTVQVDGGAELQLANNATITGATTNNSGTLRVIAQGLNNRLSGNINNNNEIILDDGARLTIEAAGTYNNSGAIKLDSAGSLTVLSIDGEVAISGGDIELSDDTNNRIAGAIGAGPNRLNLQGTSLSGAGLINVDLINSGNVSATASSALTLSNSTVNNTGTLSSSGGPLVISGTIVQNAGGLISGAQITGTTVINGDVGAATIMGTSIFDSVDILATVGIAAGQTLRLINGIDNQGDIQLGAVGPSANASLQISGTVNLGGGGTVTLEDSPNNRISNVGTSRLVNVDNTISGSGLVQFLGIDNRAVIAADGLNGLTVQPSGGALGGIINSGELKANSASTLRLNGGTIENVGGTIRADGGGTVELNNNVTVIGGSFAGNGTVVANSDVTLDGIGIVNNGNYDVVNGKSTTVIGTLFNNANVSLSATEPLVNFGPRTELFLDGDVNLEGAGNVVLSDFSANRIVSRFGQFNILTNNGNTISGSGQLGGDVTGLINRGEIRGEGDIPLVIDPRNDLGFINDTDGALVATESGGIELLAGSFENKGDVLIAENSSLNRTGDYLQTSGATVVDGVLTVSDGIEIQGGTLGGSGSVIGDVTNTATTAPGSSPGSLFVDGNFEQLGLLDIEIGGPADGDLFDKLIVTGELTLGGTLRITLIDNFVPMVGAAYQFLQAAQILGEFDNTVIVGPATFDTMIDLTSGTLQVTSAVPLPSALYLFGAGLLGLWSHTRRRSTRSPEPGRIPHLTG